MKGTGFEIHLRPPGWGEALSHRPAGDPPETGTASHPHSHPRHRSGRPRPAPLPAERPLTGPPPQGDPAGASEPRHTPPLPGNGSTRAAPASPGKAFNALQGRGAAGTAGGTGRGAAACAHRALPAPRPRRPPQSRPRPRRPRESGAARRGPAPEAAPRAHHPAPARSPAGEPLSAARGLLRPPRMTSPRSARPPRPIGGGLSEGAPRGGARASQREAYTAAARRRPALPGAAHGGREKGPLEVKMAARV